MLNGHLEALSLLLQAKIVTVLALCTCLFAIAKCYIKAGHKNSAISGNALTAYICIKYYTERMMVTPFLSCLRPNLH